MSANVTGVCHVTDTASIVSNAGPGAAGGSISLQCAGFSGTTTTGAIAANGGLAVNAMAAGGGGGRIAVVSTGGIASFGTASGNLVFPTTNTTLDALKEKVTAYGGLAANGAYPGGGAGTLFLKHSGLTRGALIAHNRFENTHGNTGRTYLPSLSGVVTSLTGARQLNVTATSSFALSTPMTNLYEGLTLRPNTACTACTSTPSNFLDDYVVTTASNNHLSLTATADLTPANIPDGSSFRSVDIFDHVDFGGNAYVRTDGDLVVVSGSLSAPGAQVSLRNSIIELPSNGELRGSNLDIELLQGTYNTDLLQASNITIGGASVYATNVKVTGTLSMSSGLLESENIESNDLTLSGGLLTHPPTTTTAMKSLVVTVGNNFTLGGTGTVDVSARGYLVGTSFGMTGPQSSLASMDRAGGSHGGKGGVRSDVTGSLSGMTFGNFRDPAWPGGGGPVSAGFAAAGGGVVRLTAAKDCTINSGGRMLSDGDPSAAGGSLKLQCERVQGTASASAVVARGGAGVSFAGQTFGGGGGGRIAFVTTKATGADGFAGSFSFPQDAGTLLSLKSVVLAHGGSSSGLAGAGGAGTLYLKHAGQTHGSLILDNLAGTRVDTNAGSTLLPSLAGVHAAGPSGNVLSVTVQSAVPLTGPQNDLFVGVKLRPNLSFNNGTAPDWTDDSIVTVTGNTASTLTVSGSLPAIAGGASFRSLDIVDSLDVASGATLETHGDLVVLGGNVSTPLSPTRLAFSDGLLRFTGTGNVHPERPDFVLANGAYLASTLLGRDISITGATLRNSNLNFERDFTQSAGLFEGQTLVVNGDLRLSGGTLTHPEATASSFARLHATVAGQFVATGGAINLNSKGFPAGTSFANTAAASSLAAHSGAGGSHGGKGGVQSGRPTSDAGETYGNYRAPRLPGAGSGDGAALGKGGGAMELAATGACTIDGGATLSVNGGAGAAGGSLFLTCASFAGSSAINALTANGGDALASPGAAGGGGGRVALVSAGNSSSFSGSFAIPVDATTAANLTSFLTRVRAWGGTASGTNSGGGAGTIYVQHTEASRGALVVENRGASGAQFATGTTLLPSFAGTVSAPPAGNTLTTTLSTSPALSAATVNLYAGAQVRPNLAFTNGTGADWSDDNILTVVSNSATGFTVLESPAAVPNGALFRSIDIVDYIHVSGGSLLESRGDIVVKQGNWNDPTAWTPSKPLKFQNGLLAQSGTADVQPTSPAYTLTEGAYRLDRLNGESFNASNATATISSLTLTQDLSSQTSTLSIPQLTARSLSLQSGSLLLSTFALSSNMTLTGGTLSHDASDVTAYRRLEGTIGGTLTLAGGLINVNAKGMPAGLSYGSSAPSNTLQPVSRAGGSHGGQGGFSSLGNAQDAGVTYGDFKNPRFPGSGSVAALGSTGGGVVSLTVTGTCAIASGSSISANGQVSAAGGSIRLACGGFSGDAGASALSASGGNGTTLTAVSYAGGGGGRIALISSGDASSFQGSLTYPASPAGLTNFKTVVRALGGRELDAANAGGGAGTIFLKHSGQTRGALIVDNEAPSQARVNTGTTKLPTLAGTLTTNAVAGANPVLNVTVTSNPLLVAAHANLYAGSDVRPDTAFDNGTPLDWSDDRVARVVSNSGAALTLDVGSDVSSALAGATFRSLILLDNLDVAGGSVLESNGDIRVNNGTVANPGSSALSFVDAFVRLNSGALLSPSFPLQTISSGAYTLGDFATSELNITGGSVVMNSLTATGNVSVSGGSVTTKRIDISGAGNGLSISGGTLAHPKSTTALAQKLEVTIANGNFAMTGGSIALDGLGYPGGYSYGANDVPSTLTASSGGVGGAHGGLGGYAVQASPVQGLTYGSFRNPRFPGSGGSFPNVGLDGGGAFHLSASGTCTLNGASSISARGLETAAGGSIALYCGGFAGTPSGLALNTRGGDRATVNAGAGGGGRIALVSSGNKSSFTNAFVFPGDATQLANLKTIVTAAGGTTNAVSVQPAGGAGTIYLQAADSPNGALIVDNEVVAKSHVSSGLIRSGVTLLPSLAGTLTSDPVSSGGNTTLALTLTSSPSLALFPGAFAGLRLRPNTAFTNGTSNDWTDDGIVTIASHTGSGVTASVPAVANALQGNTFRSIEVLDHLHVSNASTLATAGDLVVLQGNVTSPSPAARLAFTDGLLAFTDTFAGVWPADPDFTLTQGDYSQTRLNGRNVNVSGLSTSDVLLSTLNVSGNYTQSGAVVSLRTANITGDMTVSGGTLTQPASTSSTIERLVATVGGKFTLTGGSVNLSNKGFPTGVTYGGSTGPTTSGVATLYSGSSHGGMGGWKPGGSAATAGHVYGDYRAPNLPGSGGSGGNSGGGVFVLQATGACEVGGSGTINANGDINSAGGSVFLTCASFMGNAATGALSANGGDKDAGVNYAGGGGGRIALVSTRGDGAAAWSESFGFPLTPASVTAFSARVNAYGGNGSGADAQSSGGAGTVYLKHSGLTYGALIVDNGSKAVVETTAGRTVLPSFQGTVSSAPSANTLPVNLTTTPGLTAARLNIFSGTRVRTADNGTPNNWADDTFVTLSGNGATSLTTVENVSAVSSGTALTSIDILDHVEIRGRALVETNGDLWVQSGQLSRIGQSNLAFTDSLLLFGGTARAYVNSIDYTLTQGTYNVASVTANNLTVAGATLSADTTTVATLTNITSGTLSSTTLNTSAFTQSGGTASLLNLNVTGGNLSLTGGTLRHPATSATVVRKLNISIPSGNLSVGGTGTIDVSGMGYPTGYAYDSRAPYVMAAVASSFGGVDSSGGSHGGTGGMNSGFLTSSANTYGSYLNPTAAGSSGTQAGAGGGVVIATVSGTCTVGVGGSLRANGVAGGAGGSLNLTCGGFGGDASSQAITANGGNATGQQAGGGGGRIALRSTGNSSTFASNLPFPSGSTDLGSFKLAVRARGGAGLSASITGGGAGTIFAKHSAQTHGTLIVDNGLAPLEEPFTGHPYMGKTVLRGVSGAISSVPNATTFGLQSALDNFEQDILNGGMVRFDAATQGHTTPMDLSDDSLGTVATHSTSTVTLAAPPSVALTSGMTYRTLYAFDEIDVGGNANVVTRGDVIVLNGRAAAPGVLPMQFENGLFEFLSGGSLLPSTSEVTLSSTLKSQGDHTYAVVNVQAGANVSVGALSGTNAINVTGGSLTATSLSAAGPVTLSAGTVDALSVVTTGASSHITVSGGELITQSLGASADVLLSGGNLRHRASTTLATNTLVATISGNFQLGAAGKVDVTGRGFPQNRTLGSNGVPTTTTSTFAGGSHGGVGGVRQANASSDFSYGSFHSPLLPGAGTRGSSTAGLGGGAVSLNVTGQCSFTSGATLKADGVEGGAGGSLWLRCATLQGTLGADGISARGGAATSDALNSGGGGGRISLETTAGDATAFQGDFTLPLDNSSRATLLAKVTAAGGAGYSTTNGRGGSGTVHLRHAANAYGSVFIDNRATSFGSLDGKTVLVSTTASSNTVYERTNNDSLQITFPASAAAFTAPLNRFNGATLHVYPNASSANPYDVSHQQFLLTGNTVDNLLKTGGAAFPAVFGGNHRFRIVHRFQTLDALGYANVDFAGSDLMLETCALAGGDSFVLPAGSVFTNVNSVASPVCTNTSFDSNGVNLQTLNATRYGQ